MSKKRHAGEDASDFLDVEDDGDLLLLSDFDDIPKPPLLAEHSSVEEAARGDGLPQRGGSPLPLLLEVEDVCSDLPLGKRLGIDVEAFGDQPHMVVVGLSRLEPFADQSEVLGEVAQRRVFTVVAKRI